MNSQKDLMTWSLERKNEELAAENLALREELAEANAFAEHLNTRIGELMEELADLHGGIYMATGDDDYAGAE